MTNVLSLLQQTKAFTKRPPRIYLISGRWQEMVHYEYSLLPFFQTHQSILRELLPAGLDFAALTSETEDITADDYLLWYQPQLPGDPVIEKMLDRFQYSKRVVFCYENPVAYHYRRWLLKKDFIKHFSKVFSSASLLSNSEKYRWIPAWNYLIDFKTQASVTTFVDSILEKKRFLVVNPMRSGINVSPERINIIDSFATSTCECDVYGAAKLYTQPPLNRWQNRYVEEIPFAPHPYIYTNKIPVFKQYKFTLVIENIFTDWYITEKLAEPLAALSIPIYFGNPLISEYLPNLFSYAAINGHDFTDTASLVRYLKQMTNREYTERVERVREYRSEYFNLTDYKTIWEYALATLLGTETIIQHIIRTVTMK